MSKNYGGQYHLKSCNSSTTFFKSTDRSEVVDYQVEHELEVTTYIEWVPNEDNRGYYPNV